MNEQMIRSLPEIRPRIGLGSALVLALAAGLVAWVLIDRNDEKASPTPVAAAPAAETRLSADGPRIVTIDGLSAFSGLRGQRVYWAGPRPSAVYEVTANAVGHVYVRYLRSGTQLGSRKPDFLTVATYPSANAYADIEAAAKRPGATTIEVPGGLAVYDEATPTSLYLAYRGSAEQVEVYAPSALAARRVVESGLVRPVP